MQFLINFRRYNLENRRVARLIGDARCVNFGSILKQHARKHPKEQKNGD
jgi:hypothetical protein